jgi:hypothetical protein
MRDSLRAADVVAIYEQVLGREPLPEEITHQLAANGSVADLLRVALDSAEYAARLGSPPPAAPRTRQQAIVNIHHPDLEAWGHQPGVRSADGVAMVGREGWLFLCSGSNSVVEQFAGAPLEEGWLEGWHAALQLRAREVAAVGAQMAFLVVPDKLAVYEPFYPEPIVRVGPRPVELLMRESEVPVLYPLQALQEAAAHTPVFLRTDTHLTLRGNQVLYESLGELIAPAGAVSLSDLEPTTYLTSGDLGHRYDPQIVEVVSNAGSLLDARVVEDNSDEMQDVGGHIGTRRVFVNDRAADPRTVVLFGDSFGFGTASYQGLSWFLAQGFREVHFVWVPFGWDPAYARRVRAQVVVFEGAERFLTRVPLDAVDAARLAEETLGRKQGLDLSAAFND